MANISFEFFGKIQKPLLTYFIAILQWSIGHQLSASIDGGFWLELVVRQMMFSRVPPKQCASRWLWSVHVIIFLAGSILVRCGKFHFDFSVECVLSNHIFFALSLHLFLIVQFFSTARRWILFAATISQECSEDTFYRFFPNSESLCCSAVYTKIFGLFDVDSQPDFLGFFHKIVELRLHVSKIVRKEHNIVCIVEILKMFGKIPQDPSPSSI